MWRCSSRTAIAIAANESTAPSIHSTPRTVWDEFNVIFRDR
jgi:hypothetical protein